MPALRWKNVEDLRPHLDPIVHELGHLPNEPELRARNVRYLRDAIVKFGGSETVAEALGYQFTGRKHWKDITELRPYLYPIVKKLGRMPRQKELAAMKRQDLIGAIRKFNGPDEVAQALGYEYEGRIYWNRIEDLRPYLDPIVNELGWMPSQHELTARKKTGLIGAIKKFGSPQEVADKLGYPYLRGKPKKWKSIADLRSHLEPLVNDQGRMPTPQELIARGRLDLRGAITKFGGPQVVAAFFGYQYVDSQEWNSVHDLRIHLDPIVTELGRMPRITELIERGRDDLRGAIHKFDGIRKVAKALDYPYTGPREWETIDELREALDPIVQAFGRLPSRRELVAMGHSYINSGIRKFGGPEAVAESFGYAYNSRLSWASLEDLRAYLDPIVAKLGRMPSETDLLGLQRFDIANAIAKFGGYPYVAVALGYPYDGRIYWHSVDDLRPYLNPLVHEIGRMPSILELRARGMDNVAQIINKFGGMAVVAEALGYLYEFAPAHRRRERLESLEAALVQLHTSQMLSSGQIMLILRHAGLLSRGNVMRAAERLNALANIATEAPGLSPFPYEDALTQEIPIADDTAAVSDPQGLLLFPPRPERDSVDDALNAEVLSSDDTEELPEQQSKRSRRNRMVEIKELRGWSMVGNLLDPSPALVQLSVTRLKTAFYRFANERRGSLQADIGETSDEEVTQLEGELWEAAFGQYGDLIDNDLVRESCEVYIADLAQALLLPRFEGGKVPRLYQLDGARFLAQRLQSGATPYGLLFDQPGMGKTLTTLWALAAGGATRFILVAPLTVKRQVWTLDALRDAFPQLEETHLATSLDSALTLPAAGHAVAILHYEELRRHDAIGQLSAPRPDGSHPFDAVIFDEAHEVKERLTSSSRGPTKEGAWLLRQAARACIGLTATPVVNELYEPVSLLHLVQGNRDSDAGKRLQSRRLRDRVDVMEYLLADSLRRTKSDVLFEIPPRGIQVHAVTPNADQLERIRLFLGRGRRAVAAALAEYRRLVLDAKLDWIARAVRAQVPATTLEGHPDPKVLVLCYNVQDISERVYARLVAELGSERVLHVNGSTPQGDRDEAIRRFRAPADAESGIVALVGTVGTIGVGVTLFDADTDVMPHRVIFADLPYTWAEFEQGIDRLHRVGQRYPVQVDVPVVDYGEQLTRADGEPLLSFDQWIWEWVRRKQILADQVLDAGFDVSEYRDAAIRRAISQALKSTEEAGGAVIAPSPPPESELAEHRRLVGRYRGLYRHRAAELFSDPRASERFLATNDASPSTKLAHRLVRERLDRWLDRRSVVVDLGCGSHPFRDLPCERVIGVDRHGVNGGLIGDSATTGLPDAEADLVVMSLSMWGTPEDRLAYLREAKRLLRPLGKLVVVEPSHTFGGAGGWRTGAEKLSTVARRLGMRLAEANEYTADAGTSLVTFVIDNSSTPAAIAIDASSCQWSDM